MSRWAERLIERAALALFICPAIAAYFIFQIVGVPFARIVSLLVVSWVAAMLLLALPHCLRFGEGLKGALTVGLALGALLVLPLLPYLTVEGSMPASASLFFLVTLVVMVQTACVVAWGFRNQGRHFYTDRELPELEGEPRAAAEEVLRRAGLRPVSLRVAPLGMLNAFVLGLRSCVVALDPSVGKLLDREEIQALVAHEAGHVRTGGMFAGIAPVAIVLAGANCAALLGWISEVDIFGCMGAFACLRDLISQLLELHCDRFAARLTSPAAAASMLRKVHEGQLRWMTRLQGNRFLIPFFSHPPLLVRLSAVQQDDPGALRSYRRTWGLVVALFFVLPLAVLAASRALGLELHPAIESFARFLPAGFAGIAIIVHGGIARRTRKASGSSLGEVTRGKWFRRLTMAFGALLVGLLITLPLLAWLEVEVDFLEGFVTTLALSAGVFFAFVLVGLFTGVFREGIFRLPARVRKAILECGAVLQEGKPDEALAIVERALERKPRHDWLLVNRAACLLYLGRLDEAAACLEEPIARRETFPAAAFYLGFVELIRGNLERAEELAGAVIEKTPRQPLAWYLGGFIAFEGGDLPKADERFARALKVNESDGRALAGRAIVALERGESGPEVEGWLDEARRLEPLVPVVILAGARGRQAAGDLDGGRHEAARALERLRELGMRGWVPYFEKLRRRWGLEDTEAPENTSLLP